MFGFASARDETWLTPKVAKALEQSDDLWVETPPPSPGPPPLGASSVVQELGYDRSRDLFTVLPPDLAARTLAYGEKLGVTRERMAPMRPWLAREAIQRAYAAQKAGATAPAGGMSSPEVFPDAVIIARARARGMPVHSEYRTTDDVIRGFATMPEQAQIEYLQNLLDYFDGDASGANADTFDWIYGEPSDRLILEQKAKTPALYDAMHRVRNEGWAERIDDLLAGGVHFILLGGNHVLGPDSVQNCCQRIGITMEEWVF